MEVNIKFNQKSLCNRKSCLLITLLINFILLLTVFKYDNIIYFIYTNNDFAGHISRNNATIINNIVKVDDYIINLKLNDFNKLKKIVLLNHEIEAALYFGVSNLEINCNFQKRNKNIDMKTVFDELKNKNQLNKDTVYKHNFWKEFNEHSFVGIRNRENKNINGKPLMKSILKPLSQIIGSKKIKNKHGDYLFNDFTLIINVNNLLLIKRIDNLLLSLNDNLHFKLGFKCNNAKHKPIQVILSTDIYDFFGSSKYLINPVFMQATLNRLKIQCLKAKVRGTDFMYSNQKIKSMKNGTNYIALVENQLKSVSTWPNLVMGPEGATREKIKDYSQQVHMTALTKNFYITNIPNDQVLWKILIENNATYIPFSPHYNKEQKNLYKRVKRRNSLNELQQLLMKLL